MTNIRIGKGEDEVLNFTITDSWGTAVNITGGTISFLVYSKSGWNAVITKTASIISWVDGTCSVTLADTDTDITAWLYFYELWLVDSGWQKIQVIPKSPFIVLPWNAPA